MSRLPVLLLCVAAGCSAAVHTNDPALDAAVAAEGAKAIVQARKAAPPAPKPVTPAGACDRCGGRGYIGDQAAIRLVCPACKGTGKTACQNGRCQR